MFDRPAALAHLLRVLVEPALNGFEKVLMFLLPRPSPRQIGDPFVHPHFRYATDTG
jgi:hypothetical protein